MAVYTDVSAEDLHALLARYDIGSLTAFKGIAEGVENTNYLLATDRGQFILTLYEKRVARHDLPFFLALMEHLSSRGVTCPTPVRDISGSILQELAGKPAALITFLSGYSLRKPFPGHCFSLGKALAAFHLGGLDFTPARHNTLSTDGWVDLSEVLGNRPDRVANGMTAEIAAELIALRESWPRGLAAGVIHADLFPDNVFFLDGTVSGVIDFYFACNDLLAYDIAICLNAWCFESDHAFNVTKARALLKGYASVRPLAPEEIEALPILARGSALRFLLTRLQDWFDTPDNAVVKRKDPLEYWKKLRFHRTVQSSAAYGF